MFFILPRESIAFLRRKLVGAEALLSVIKYLKSGCEIRALTFGLSQQSYFNTTLNFLPRLEYSPGYSRHSRISGKPFIFLDENLQRARNGTDLFILHAINHLNEEPRGSLWPANGCKRSKVINPRCRVSTLTRNITDRNSSPQHRKNDLIPFYHTCISLKGKHAAVGTVYPQCNGFNKVINLQKMSVDENLMTPVPGRRLLLQ